MSAMIREIILLTCNPDGSPHIAPFGIREQDGQIRIAPFRPSASLDNMLRTRTAVVCATEDVRVFAGALAGRHDWPMVPAVRITGWVLDAALAHRELELLSVHDDATRPELLFRVVHAAQHAPFPGFNRAQAAVIEAAVLVSRLDRLPASQIDTELAYLFHAVDKTAGPREREAWGWLMERVAAHRNTARDERA